ncbi:hypothetical protein K503DRAFT_777973 [Rhizopogon vinicolor AM-OR11-026]|uniref:Uncharacterized protein n=1 Tax=Rhizopogon vinicolor AM-OR11-026 TaxID=1314800 RepID=A0A1B7ME60_9AGAM|nr:hypothetical protein K503DRAFT_777973 [Rhizopogon vinicolor AM-OR11-026]
MAARCTQSYIDDRSTMVSSRVELYIFFYHVHAPLIQEKNSDGKPTSRTIMICTLVVQFSSDGTTNTFIIPTSHLNDSH